MNPRLSYPERLVACFDLLRILKEKELDCFIASRSKSWQDQLINRHTLGF
jgi:hypothetical protein